MKKIALGALFALALIAIPAAAQLITGGGSSSGGGGTGCVPSGSIAQLLTDDGAGACTSNASATVSAGALSLGASGTLGSVTMGNITSGTLTLRPVTGALGTVTVSVPAATDTLVNLTSAQTLTNKTLTAPIISTISNTGTLTLPTSTDTLVGRATTDTLTNKSISGATNTITAIPLSAFTNLGTTTTVLHGNAAGSPTFSAVSLTADVSGILPSANGGAGTINGIMAANGSGTTNVVTMGACFTYSSSTLSGTYTINAQTGTSYTILSSDACKLVTFSNGSAIAVTLPQATGSFAAGFAFDVQNKGAGSVTITPTTSTINGSATLVIATNQGCSIVSDGTNYQVASCTALGSGAGTVTSVAQSFTGGLISVGGSPVTTSGTLALTVAGTSGGIPYFSGASTWASSGALTANLPVFGGGAGAAPIVGTRSGNTTQVVTTTGAQTSGDCVKIDANGNHIANGSACGGGGSAGFAHPGYAANYYYTTPVSVLSDVTVTANRLYAIPFIAGATDTMTKISIRVKAAVASTACELGVYGTTNGRPDALIEDSGNVATTSTGTKEVTGRSISLTAGNTYWLAVGCNGAPDLRASDTSDQIKWWFIGTDDPDFGAEYLYGAWTYSVGALPGTFPTISTNGAKMPLVYLRK